MGCDIHIWAEVRGSDGRWYLHKAPQDKLDVAIAERAGYGYEDEDEEEVTLRATMTASDLDTGRNYRLFGILANVRWYDEHRSFGDKRGVPEDASSEYLSEIKGWGLDAHSASYISLKELLEWAYWHEVAGTEFWYDDPVFNALIDKLKRELLGKTEEERWEILRSARNSKQYPEPPSRVQTYSDMAGEFYSETIPMLVGLGEPEDVRIVFFFDN